MADFLMSISLFPMVLTLLCYQIGLWCQKKWKNPIFNPILIGMLLVIGANTIARKASDVSLY